MSASMKCVVLSAAIAGAAAQKYAGQFSYIQELGKVYTENDDTSARVTVNGYDRHQTMIGGGCSGAFGIACNQFGSAGLSPANQEMVTQILFDENIGGLSVVRNDIGSTPGVDTILGSCPATPSSPLNITGLANGTDECQLTLTQTALKYNPDLFVYADAWSAPGCFKDQLNENDGGHICGVRGSASNCSYDWRQTYADYLIEYVKLYQEQGINISMIGLFNEPDFNPSYYESMLSDGFQAKDILEVFYPTAKAAFPDLLISCCDATGFRQEQNILYELARAGGAGLYDVATWHNYQSEPFEKLNTIGQPNLQSEWADGTGDWNPNWDVSGQLAEGFQWALYMHQAFTLADTSGYLHWWCAQNTTGDNALIRLQNDEYFVSARLWAFASYFRFARPGSVRVGATSTAPYDVYVSAYINTNGTVAVDVINSAHFTYDLQVDLMGVNVTRGTAFLTDNDHNVTNVGGFAIEGSAFTASIEPRSMKVFYLEY